MEENKNINREDTQTEQNSNEVTINRQLESTSIETVDSQVVQLIAQQTGEQSAPIVVNKNNRKSILIILGILLLVSVVFCILYFFKDNNVDKDIKEDNSSNSNSMSNDKIMKEYGNKFLAISNKYIDENRSYPNYEDIKDSILELGYNVNCEEIIIYKYDKIYLGKCSVNDSSNIYSYGYRYEESYDSEDDFIEDDGDEDGEEEENVVLNFVDSNSDLYNGYQLATIKHPTKYEPAVYISSYEEIKQIFKDPNIIENFTYIGDEDDDSEKWNEVTATFKVKNGFVYINILDEEIKIEGINNAKQVFATTRGVCSDGEFDAFVLTKDNRAYIYEHWNSPFDSLYTTKKELINDVKKLKMNEIKIKNKYKEVKLGVLGGGSSCGSAIVWVGLTESGEEYVISEDGEILVREYFPYSYYGIDIAGMYYIVDLEGNVKSYEDDENENKQEIDLNIKASYIFSWNTDGEYCDFILDNNDKLNMICANNNYATEVKRAKVKSIYYKESDNYDVIFIFEDNTALILEDIYMPFRDFKE